MMHHTPSKPAGAVTPGVPFQTRLFPSQSLSPANQSQPLLSPSTTHTKCTAESCKISSWKHFPVSFRSGDFDDRVTVVDYTTFSRFLEVEFSLARLDDVYSKLWRVGYPRPPRPLHTQLQLGRMIVLTDSLDMHLVWGNGKIFLKPLPRYLLEPEFWDAHLAPDPPAGSAHDVQPQARETSPAAKQGAPTLESRSSTTPDASSPSQRGIRGSALGLLYTYACLIAHPNDFRLALEQGLIPSDAGSAPDWETWRAFAVELLHPDIARQVHRRFERGELRLDRLNWIYIFKGLPFSKIYYTPWTTYTDFVTANLSLVAATTVYIVIVLTAMQVGLSTDALKDNGAFQRASYGFTVFAILGPIAAGSLVMFALLIQVVPNWNDALAATRRLKPSVMV
ncbi:hypothetical protein F4802DRAFT_590887 [Xylaria palmicola]|nr:hypothetical protein F4802DRAFT_590887 [Xylaria palmicola]